MGDGRDLRAVPGKPVASGSDQVDAREADQVELLRAATCLPQAADAVLRDDSKILTSWHLNLPPETIRDVGVESRIPGSRCRAREDLAVGREAKPLRRIRAIFGALPPRQRITAAVKPTGARFD